MADDTTLNPGVGGDVIVTDSLGGVPERKVQAVKLMLGASGVEGALVDGANPLPVTGAVTLAAGRVQGIDAHDAPLTADPVLEGGRASAAAPADVSADGDAVRGWRLRNGAAVAALVAAGTLIAAGSGTQATALRVTLATDSPGSGDVAVEDAVSAADPTGSPMMARRRATPISGEVSAAGDWVALNSSNFGSLYATLIDTAGSAFGTSSSPVISQDSSSLVDNAAFTDGTSRVLPIGWVFDEVAGTALTENDVAAARIDSKRAVVGVLEDATTRGQRLAINAGGALEAQGDVAHDAVGTGVNPLLGGGYASAAAPTDVSADGDAVRSWHLRNGAQAVVVTAAGTLIAAGSGTQATALRVTLATDSPLVSSLVTEDAAAAADPIGFPLMARRRDIPIATTEVSAAGDNIALNAANDGALWSRVPNKQTSASFTSTGTLDVDVTGMSEVYINITGGFVGTVQFIGDSTVALGVNPGILRAFNISTFALETQTTVPAKYFLPVGGLGSFRINVTAYTSGQIDVAVSASAGSSVLHVTDGGGSLTVDGAITSAGTVAHDAVGTGVNPLLGGGYASAAAPTDVSADGDAVRAWYLRSGAQAVQVTAAGTLIAAGNGTAATALRVTLASDSTGTTIVTQATAANLNAQVQGTAATDAAVTGNPVLEGGRASTATPTAMSADGDAVPRWLDRSGASITTGYTARDNVIAGNPVIVGGRASTTAPSSVSADGDAVDIWCLRDGSVATSIQSVAVGASMNIDGHAAHDAVWSDRPVPTGLYASQASPAIVSADGDVTRQWGDRRGASVVVQRPVDWGSLGIYKAVAANGTTAMTAGLAAASPIVAFRWGDATNKALIRSVRFSMAGTATAFAAGLGTFDLFIARSYTASDTGGTALTLTGSNNKLRTSMGTTLLTDLRRSTTATLTAGTRTLDANPVGTLTLSIGTAANVQYASQAVLYEAVPGDHPIVLAQNEGLVIQATVPGTGTWFYNCEIAWAEVVSY